MTNFTDAEILDLISEVSHDLQLCVSTTIPGDRTLGIPNETRLVCRPFSGYVYSDPRRQGAIANSAQPRQELGSGLTALISAASLSREDLNQANAVIAYQGRYYQFEYSLGISDRGVVKAHQVQLTKAMSSDEIIKK